MKRTNIMLTDEQHRKLKLYAKKEGRTLGELVRDALDLTYKKKNDIEYRKAIALDAYKEGFISLGKLAEILGVDIVSARLYLKGHGISIRVQELHEIARDAANA
jgi:predicted HTH domain antitoxin